MIKPLLSLAFVCLLVLRHPAYPASKEFRDASALRSLILLHEGRQKPLDTYARTMLTQFSGRSQYAGHSALEWLAKVFFTPEKTKQHRIFLINNSQTLEAMGVETGEDRRYSYQQLAPGLKALSEVATEVQKIEEKERNAAEAEILRVYNNLTQYINIAATFQFAIPYENFAVRDSTLAHYLGLPADSAQSYYTLFGKADLLFQVLDTLKSKASVENWTPLEQEIMKLTQKMFQWSNFYRNIPVNLIPTMRDGEEVWVSPWDALNNPNLLRRVRPELEALAALCETYLKGDASGMRRAKADFEAAVEERVGNAIAMDNPNLEIIYNQINPFFWLKVIYGFGALLLLASFIGWRRWFYFSAAVLVCAGALLNTGGILTRMAIMGRPPVTNLYETFIFVSWACVLLGLTVEYFQRRGIGLLCSGVSGFFLMMIAGKYAREGDTMGMLVAVLDSNFWLATHVVCITLGYAGACAAGVVGHVYVVQELLRVSKERLRDTYRAMYGILAFGLVFSFVGTVLGGIWADQSWGRFWGWDPKENGALLIVLWCAILFHARLDGMIRGFGFALGAAAGIMVVMFAWFGVNLMGVGLHSYGFTSGVFYRLMAYAAFETTFILGAWALYLLRQKARLKA